MFTEQMTAAFYDAEDAKYRRFWDPAGSLHWGVFEHDQQPFLEACAAWNRAMLEAARVTSSARLLDLGCGNGTVASWIAGSTGAEVVGVDISKTRIAHARRQAAGADLPRLSYRAASATRLPFADGHFTHVFSQAALYHTHDRARAHAQAARVLAPGGLLALDDLTTPRQPVSPLGRRFVYDRLLFQPTFSRDEYLAALEEAGFLVLESRDLSPHLARSYRALAELAREEPGLVDAYRAIPDLVAAGDVGWAFFLAQRVPDRLGWIYDTRDSRFTLQQKYDAWARRYDRDLDQGYAESPRVVAELAARYLPAGASILDAGAGTGLVGQQLEARGFRRLTALDRSNAMLDQARKKGVYHRLVQGPLQDSAALFGRGSFDAVTAVGVFTFAHAPLADLAPLLEVLRPGGYAFLAVRADYLAMAEGSGCRLADFGVEQLEHVSYRIFDDEPMLAFVLRKPGGRH
jgi:SAM-dependent methyltransferase